MLDNWERVSIDDVIARVDGEGGDPRARLRRLFALASYSRDVLKIDLAIRDWSRRDATVGERLATRRQPTNEVPALALRWLLRRRGRRRGTLHGRHVAVRGSHFIAADHAGRRRADVVDLVLSGLLA
jgi:hypothetical protein